MLASAIFVSLGYLLYTDRYTRYQSNHLFIFPRYTLHCITYAVPRPPLYIPFYIVTLTNVAQYGLSSMMPLCMYIVICYIEMFWRNKIHFASKGGMGELRAIL